MSATPDLVVKVLDDRDIVVIMPECGLQVTYRRDGRFPMLVLIDSLRDDRNPSKFEFIAKVWRIAYYEAKALGWLG